MAYFSNSPEATFDEFYSSDLARMGWQPQYYGNEIVGYWRPVALDDSRGPRQVGVTDDRAIEFVPADKINGGNPDPKDVEYRTAGKNIAQNDPRGWGVLSTVGPVALGLMAGGAAANSLGLMGAGSGAAGAAEGLAGTPEITEAMLAGANATSDPIAYLNAQAGWTASDPAYLATLTTVPPGTSTPGYGAPPEWPTGKQSGDVPSKPPSGDVPSKGSSVTTGIPWLDTLIKVGTPLLGGGLAAYEASKANNQQNPQDAWTRDYLRGLLTGPQPTNQTSGLLGTISQLQNKRYY